MRQVDFVGHICAPCGMNCAVCYRHLGKKPCHGCNHACEAKPVSCKNCRIKNCAAEKGVRHCWMCEKFPCRRIKTLEKSYRTRYGVSLLENSRMVEEQGVAAFQAAQQKQYTCPACGGVISLHDGICSGCKAEHPQGRGIVGK